MEQIIARAVRFCSHTDLPASQQNVKVFIHLSSLTYGNGTDSAITNYRNLNKFSLDEHIYNTAQNKLVSARTFYTAMKEISIDCNINRNGNLSRLNPFFKIDPSRPTNTEGILQWKLSYLDYSSGEEYDRKGSKQYFTLGEIIQDQIEDQTGNKFKTSTGSTETIRSDLIIKENTVCSDKGASAVDDMSAELENTHINYTVVKDLLMVDGIQVPQLADCLDNIVTGKLTIEDKEKMKLVKSKIKQFTKKASEKPQMIAKIAELFKLINNEEVDTTLLREDTLDNIKDLYTKLNNDLIRASRSGYREKYGRDVTDKEVKEKGGWQALYSSIK